MDVVRIGFLAETQARTEFHDLANVHASLKACL